ncbi:putative esterase of the alpha-beta hydrolase superfamily [Caulobacter sp. AP07]|uniref:patatin-like phospholipase family protein n=1 Tax=Caulobacter sp. AP07 TaxID=1144304 RepID=UPI000272200A|nr:patatin-like phospholipase family protein [Caulobacter sp. AP07]EJL34556.1 putative esterase of the alpha-beta hydrolase superfamily [Caulobacter sp. AP07]
MRPIRLLALLCLTFSLAACGSLSRDTFQASDLALAPPNGLADLRFNASDSEAAIRFGGPARKRAQAQKSFDVLALSGGGSNGAYGAGVLVGWSKRGERPEFDIVTGVSTGALAAPFAFLGSTWDERLTEASTGPAAGRVLKSRGLGVLFHPSFYSNAALHSLVDTYVTDDMLQAIVAEHKRGRRLLIATTNLDTEETVIWDMGAIASRGGEESRELFKNVMVASASIPGVFPPTLIEIGGEGRHLSEMHVDGGVTIPFFVAPESLLLWTADKGSARPGRMFVIVNGKVGGAFGFTKGGAVSIVGRSWDTMSKALMRTHLAASSAFARRNGGQLFYSAIPDTADVDASGLDFASNNRNALFKLGYERAIAGWAWALSDSPEETAGAPPVVPAPPATGDH